EPLAVRRKKEAIIGVQAERAAVLVVRQPAYREGLLPLKRRPGHPLAVRGKGPLGEGLERLAAVCVPQAAQVPKEVPGNQSLAVGRESQLVHGGPRRSTRPRPLPDKGPWPLAPDIPELDDAVPAARRQGPAIGGEGQGGQASAARRVAHP